MRKFILSVLPLMFLFSFQAEGQEYSSAIGLRAGLGANVSYKKFVGREAAFELMGGFYFDDFYAGLAFEKHNYFPNNISGLTWYWGAGGAISIADGGLGVGALGAIGLEYAFNDIPLNVSLDWMPHIFIIGGSFKPGGGGLAIRYILDR